MKAMVTESPDMDSIFSDLTSSPFLLKGVDVNRIVLDHLMKLNLSKKTSMNKAMPRIDDFSVSQSSYDCYRKIFFEMQYPRTSNENSLGRFAVGDIIDEIMKNAFMSMGGSPGSFCRKEYLERFSIRGEPDIEFPDIIIEVKSVSPFAWKYVAGGKDRVGNIIIGEPKIQHVRQLNTYLDIKGLEDGLILYVNKDDLKLKPFKIKHSEGLMMQTVGRCATVHSAIWNGKVPDGYKGSKECAYCNHTDLCKRYL